MGTITTTTQCSVQGGSLLRMDNRIYVKDAHQNIIHNFPLSDYGAIADQGEFYRTVSLSSAYPSFTFDESITGYTGDTAADDVDLIYIQCSYPILVQFASGIPLNSVTPGSRNPNGPLMDINTVFLAKSNYSTSLIMDTNYDQRILPFTVYLQDSTTMSNITVYLAKFSR